MGNGTELGRVRGLGSAKEGAHHWWAQRVTAAANLFLMVWFFVAIARMPAYDYDTARGWLQSPWAAIPMGLLIVSVFYHFRLGLQVLIEDYVHGAARVAWLLIQRPIGFRDRFRSHQLIGLEVRERFFAAGGLDPLPHERRVDACVDNQVRDVNVPWTELASGALCYGPQSEFSAGEC